MSTPTTSADVTRSGEGRAGGGRCASSCRSCGSRWARLAMIVGGIAAGLRAADPPAAVPHHHRLRLRRRAVHLASYVLVALGLNIVIGYAGLLDLGYVGFYAIGAYTVGVLDLAARALAVPAGAAAGGRASRWSPA